MGIRRDALPSIDDHFTIIRNDYVRDRRLSRRARGLLAELTSHKIGWASSISSLVKAGPEGKDALRSAIHELEACGYLERIDVRVGGRYNEVDYKLVEPPATEGQKSDHGGNDDDGSTDDEESATKKNISLEDQEIEPPEFCPKHSNGFGPRCGQCGDARRIHARWMRAHRIASHPTASGIITPPTCSDGYPIGECPYCDQEAQIAV